MAQMVSVEYGSGHDLERRILRRLEPPYSHLAICIDLPEHRGRDLIDLESKAFAKVHFASNVLDEINHQFQL
jgi:hypothetical protein